MNNGDRSLKGQLTVKGQLSGRMSSPSLSGQVSVPTVISETNYEHLSNKPTINGVIVSGNLTLQDLKIVSENTTSGWNATPDYIPKAGEICMYTDYAVIDGITYYGIKIGDGSAYLIDLPFVGEDVRNLVLGKLAEHEQDSVAHITSEERAFWNNKLNYEVSGEELTLNRN